MEEKPPLQKPKEVIRPQTTVGAAVNSNSFTGGAIGPLSASVNLNSIKELVEAEAPKDNQFHLFFQEMNEKASDAISRGEAEPERALEFLKQAEAFLNKIQKSKKNHIKTDTNQSGDSSFLNGRI